MVEHRDLAAWCDAVADKQTETVGQQPVALLPFPVLDNDDLATHRWSSRHNQSRRDNAKRSRS